MLLLQMLGFTLQLDGLMLLLELLGLVVENGLAAVNWGSEVCCMGFCEYWASIEILRRTDWDLAIGV